MSDPSGLVFDRDKLKHKILALEKLLKREVIGPYERHLMYIRLEAMRKYLHALEYEISYHVSK